MSQLLSRRHFIASTSALCVAPVLMPGMSIGQEAYADGTSGLVHFPSQDPAQVKEMVGVAHGNVARVRELLEGSPALAKGHV